MEMSGQNQVPANSPEKEWLGSKVEHSPVSSAKVNVCFYDVHSDNFTLFTVLYENHADVGVTQSGRWIQMLMSNMLPYQLGLLKC